MGRKPKDEPDLSHILPDLRPLAVRLDTLVPDVDNPRAHGPKDVAILKESFKLFGQRSALVVRQGTNVIQAGHGRRLAAMELGWTHIAVVHSDDDDTTSRHYQLTDNKSAEASEWDWPRVASVIGEMLDDGAERDDFVLLGWDDGELDMILAADWSPPKLDKDYDPKLGGVHHVHIELNDDEFAEYKEGFPRAKQVTGAKTVDQLFMTLLRRVVAE